MSYCTRQGMIERFGELELIQLTDSHNSGIIDEGVLTQAMDDANTEVDGYLAGIMELPLSNIPGALARSACDMARFYLFNESVPDAVEKRYEISIRYLTAIAKGQIALGAPVIAPTVNPAIVGIRTGSVFEKVV